jgi:hypothetical protein
MDNSAANLSPLFINRELKMKTTILAAAAVLVSFAAPAMAWEGKVVACYDSVRVPAKLKHTRICTLQLTLSGSTVVANW